MNADYYKNKVVAVTGASSGIGKEMAISLAKLGAIPILVARREDRLKEVVALCREHSEKSDYLVGDLGEKAFAESIISETVERFSRVDILINNAAVPLHKALYRISSTEAEDVMRINFLSCLWTTFAAIPQMLKQRGGTIVNVSSFAAKVCPTHETIYSASKCAMDGLTRGLWIDLEGSGIHAMLIHPGAIQTEIWGKLDEPGAYDGKLYPVERFVEDSLAAIEKKKFEVMVPNGDVKLWIARILNKLLPSVIRKGVGHADPIKPGSVDTARQRAMDGYLMGELGER